MPCCGRRPLSPKQQAKYDRAMIDALAAYRQHGQNSPEAQEAFQSVRQIVRASERAQEILKAARG